MTLTDFESKLLDRLNDLCNRITRLETEFRIHIENRIRESDNRVKQLTLLFGGISTILVILNIIQIFK